MRVERDLVADFFPGTVFRNRAGNRSSLVGKSLASRMRATGINVVYFYFQSRKSQVRRLAHGLYRGLRSRELARYNLAAAN